MSADMMHNSVEDKIIDGLNFNLEPGASYVLNRRFCTFQASGSNIYTARSLIRVVLTGNNDWLDPSTLRIMFDLRNTDGAATKRLRPIGGPWSFFRRMRVLMGGTLVEDIDNYARTHQMFNQLTAQDSRNNKMVEGFGPELDISEAASTINNPNGAAPSLYPGIKGGQSKTVLFKPLSGIFSQNKYIPLKYSGPIIIELELCSDSGDPVILADAGQSTATQYFVAANTSSTWQIENVQVKCDVCTLDNNVENVFTQHMLDGGSFPLRYDNYISQLQPIPAGTVTVMVNVTRTASRLKSCFVTLNKHSGPS